MKVTSQGKQSPEKAGNSGETPEINKVFGARMEVEEGLKPNPEE